MLDRDSNPDNGAPPANSIPGGFLRFVNALAELLVCAYRRETIEQGSGDSPEMHKTTV